MTARSAARPWLLSLAACAALGAAAVSLTAAQSPAGASHVPADGWLLAVVGRLQAGHKALLPLDGRDWVRPNPTSCTACGIGTGPP